MEARLFAGTPGGYRHDMSSDRRQPPLSEDDERWLVIGGRRWRRTDPSLPEDLIEKLKSHLGRGRAGVRAAQRADDADAVASARLRVNLAKHGLGERGPYWWEVEEPERLRAALRALQQLDALDRPE